MPPPRIALEALTRVDAPGWIDLRAQLWPECTPDQHRDEMAGFVAQPERYVQFIARSPDREALGFVEASLRTDPVIGADSSPVIYLEGLYVRPDARRQGVARLLVQAVADWGAARGCTEMASDTPLENTLSQAVHRRLGFRETQRVVCFSMTLQPRDAH